MAQVKGKFIILSGHLMCVNKSNLKKADDILFSKTGKHWDELEPENWYDTSLFNTFMEFYADSSLIGERGIIAIGKRVYPTIEKTVGLPKNLKEPLDLIKFEAEGFLQNHKGDDVIPRTFVKVERGDVIVQAPAPGYNCVLYEGVFLGILEMFGVRSGIVEQTKCVKNGDNTCEFHIQW